jgi:ABC-type transport system substrate-binding protein
MKHSTLKTIAALLCGFALHGSVHAKADPNKVLRINFEAADDGFDMMRTNSLYTSWIAMNIFEGLLRYDYLARPVKLVPATAAAMPEITDGGKTYLFHIKKGIYFSPDPAFKGVRRELVANDYAYSIKRLMDPVNRSPKQSDYEGRIVGMDALVADALKTGKFDYDKPLAGLETPDRYTLRIRLLYPDPVFTLLMAESSSAAVAREVMEKYGNDSGRHPIGTGAYLLREYVPRSKVILEANPDYRGFIWDMQSDGTAWDENIVREMKGKHMPQIGRVEVSIVEEQQSRWLAFVSGQSDIDLLAENAAPRILDGDKLKPEFSAKGVKLFRFADPGSTRTYFNFKDPTVGGYTKDKIALRRAIAMSFNRDEEIAQAYFGQALKAESDVPPGVLGFNPDYRNSIPFDRDLAIGLLDKFNYRKGPDGFRNLPDGKPLTLKIHSAPNSRDVTKMELWKKSLNAIGLRVDFPVAGFADNLKAAYQCELMMFGLGGVASIPDGSDFMTNYYGPNAKRGNFGCYQSTVFDDAFDKARLMQDSPERTALYDTMTRQLEADTARFIGLWRIRNWVLQPWVRGYKKHPIMHADWQFLDVERK